MTTLDTSRPLHGRSDGLLASRKRIGASRRPLCLAIVRERLQSRPKEESRWIGVACEASAARNGMPFDESQSPKLKGRNQAKRAAQTLAHPSAGKSFARGLATRPAPAIRPRAKLRSRKSDQRAVFFGVQDHQSGFEIQLPGGDSRARAGGQFLLVPGLCHQRIGHLQAYRIHARPVGEEARREDGVRARLPSRVFRTLSAQRRPAQPAFSRRNGLPSGIATGRRWPVRRRTGRQVARRSPRRTRGFPDLGAKVRA